jgi:uncharacterized surface protein with fasciclin (FAS1) repeats
MQRSFVWSLVLVFGLLMAACAPSAAPAAEEAAPTEAPMAEATEAPVEEEASDEMAAADIVDTAVAAGDFETLVAAVTAAGLVDTLKSEGPFTVFAPADSAFAALPEGTVEGLLEDPEGALTDVLLYHVVPGKVMAADVVGLDGQSVETVGGGMLEIAIDGDSVLINGIAVAAPDIETSNGVIHVIDGVLIPASDEMAEGEGEMAEEGGDMADIVDTAVAAGDFETLVAAVTAAGLVDTLKSEGPFTVFAPADSAFAALPEGTVEGLLEDPEGALTDVLLYHVVPGKVMAADVVGLDGQSVETVGGGMLEIAIDGDSVLINGIAVAAPDIETSNGVIHVIDGVLIPASDEMAEGEGEMAEESGDMADIVDTAVAAGDFETLVAAVTAAGLVDTLKSEGPFTVFAPADSAFAALPEGTVEGLLEDPEGALTDVLLYHVVPGKVMAADVVGLDGQSVETVGGGMLEIAIDGDSVLINGIAVAAPDIETSNGVIHVIDGVLIP